MRTMRLALANVVALRRRLIGLIVLTAVAVALCAASFAITQRAQAAAVSRLQEGVANRSILLSNFDGRDSVKPLTPRTLQAAAAVPGVADVEPVVQAEFDYRSDTVAGVLLYATTPRAALPPPIVGQTREHLFPLRAGEAVLPATSQGSDLRPLLGKTITVEITRYVREGEGEGVDRRITVVGLFDPSWQIDGPYAAYLDAGTVNDWAALRAGLSTRRFLDSQGYDSATVLATDSGSVHHVMKALQAQRFAASSLQDELTALPVILELVHAVGYALVVILLLLTALASYQVTSALARQRNREIGILKAVGFTDGRVFRVISAEAILVAVVAAVSGLVLSVVVATAGNALLRRQATAREYLDAGVIAPHLTIVAAALVGVVSVLGLAALVPAWRAARLTPAEAIREW